MRSMAGTTFAKIFLFGLLILSFGAWGLADYVSTDPNHPGTTAASVGDQTITIYDLSGAYRQSLLESGLSSLPPEQIRQLGVANSVLNGLIAEAVVDQHTKDLGLTAGAATLRGQIQADPSFQSDLTNGFDRARYDAFLAATGQSEAAFLVGLKETVARNQLLTSVISGAATSSAVSTKLFQWRNEARVANILSIPVDTNTSFVDPNTATLSSYFEASIEDFRIPELRQVSYLSIDPSELAADIEVTEDALQDFYEQRIAEFTQPERRDVLQMLLPDEESALTARQRILDGESFLDVATDLTGASEQTVRLGLLQRADIPDEAVAETAFSLTEGELSEPSEGLFGWFLVQVDTIEPESVEPFAALEERLRGELAANEAIEVAYTLSQDLDDQLGGGATLEEAATALSLTVQEAEIDAGGRSEFGDLVMLPDRGAFLRTLSDLEPGDESLLEETRSDGFFVVRLDDVVPSRTPSLNEVEGKVVEAWKTEQRFAALQSTVDALVSQLEQGADMEALATEGGYSWVSSGPFTREGGGQNVPFSLRGSLFEASEGDVLVDRASTGFQIVQLVEVQDPTEGENADENLTAFSRQLAIGVSVDLIAQLREALQGQVSVSIDQDVVDLVY